MGKRIADADRISPAIRTLDDAERFRPVRHVTRLQPFNLSKRHDLRKRFKRATKSVFELLKAFKIGQNMILVADRNFIEFSRGDR